MHDHHAIELLIERLSELDDVAEVRIRARTTFSREALRQAYEMLTVDTPLQGSRLVVEELPEERGCPACGASFTLSPDDVAGHVVQCPECGALSPIGSEGAAIEVVAVDHA